MGNCVSSGMNWSNYLSYYDGQLLWRERPVDGFLCQRSCNSWNARFVGKPAGSPSSKGYLNVRFAKRLHKAHRVVWEMFNGPIPIGMQVDHINGDKTDNRLENLRLATNAENARNSGPQRNNTSGLIGVSMRKANNRWVSYIQANGNRISLGEFDTKGLAAVARAKAAIRYHGKFARFA